MIDKATLPKGECAVNRFKKCVLLFLALFVIAALAVYHNSFSIALCGAGLRERSAEYVDIGIDDNGNDYKIVFGCLPDDTVKFVHLTKDGLGVWHITEEASGQDPAMGWMRFAGVRRYDAGDPTSSDCEVHTVYGGNHATKRITIPTEQLPPNVAVNVIQSGAAYAIHFVTYGAAETLNQINIAELLQ